MKKTKVISTIAMLLATSALVFSACDLDGAGDTTDDPAADETTQTTDTTGTPAATDDGTKTPTDSGTTNPTTGSTGSESPASTLVDTGSASDLAAYTYHKSLINVADSWGSGTGVTVADDKATMVSGDLWGAGGVCGVANVGYGEIADYKYIVFTLDTTDYTISEALEDPATNTGVAIKVPEVIVRPTKYFTVNGKTTYYIETSAYSSASSATAIALIVGGEGTLVVDDFYLAAESEPAEKTITYTDAVVYAKGNTLTLESWGVGTSAEFTADGIVATGASAYFGILTSSAVQFNAGANLEVTYTADKAWKIKPVAPEVETEVAAGENQTVKITLGDKAGTLTKVGLVFPDSSTNLTITSIKVVDNE